LHVISGRECDINLCALLGRVVEVRSVCLDDYEMLGLGMVVVHGARTGFKGGSPLPISRALQARLHGWQPCIYVISERFAGVRWATGHLPVRSTLACRLPLV
jgi:hypothetical protein